MCEHIIFFSIGNFKKEFLHRKTFAWSGANNSQLLSTCPCYASTVQIPWPVMQARNKTQY